jgi:peptidoglycan/LPS O-acetylase OafA/YrhL
MPGVLGERKLKPHKMRRFAARRQTLLPAPAFLPQLCGGFVCGFVSTPAMILLGEASFAMYILHEPLLRLSQILRVPAPVSFVATVGLSVACFLWYERPARKALR